MLSEAASRRHLSDKRLAAYSQGSTLEFALGLYEWNIALSAPVYESLHRVEVVVRNALDRELATWNETQVHRTSGQSLGRAWLVTPAPPLRRLMGASWVRALRRTEREPRGSHPDAGCQHADALTQLPFSTWRRLLPDADPGRQLLWIQATHRAFPNLDGY